MSKWEVIYRETITRSVVVEANDRISAMKKVLHNRNFDFSDAETISKPGRKEYLTANELKD